MSAQAPMTTTPSPTPSPTTEATTTETSTPAAGPDASPDAGLVPAGTPYAVLCSLELLDPPERVGAAGGSSGWRLHLGLNLATALWKPPSEATEVNEKERRFLQPWIWLTGDLALRAFLHDPEGTTEALTAPGIRVFTDLGEEPPGLSALKDRLAKQVPLERSQCTWKPRRTARARSAHSGTPSRPWAPRLGELSQLPWPLPQHLRLTHRFQLHLTADEWARVDGGASLLVAPVLPAGLVAEADSGDLAPVHVDDQDHLPTLAYHLPPPPEPDLDAQGTVAAPSETTPADGSHPGAGRASKGDAARREATPVAFCFCNPLAVSANAAPPAVLLTHPRCAAGPWALTPYHEDWRSHFEGRLRASLRMGPDLVQAMAGKPAGSAAGQAGGAVPKAEAWGRIRRHLAAYGGSPDIVLPPQPGGDGETVTPRDLQALTAACEAAYTEDPAPALVRDLRKHLLEPLAGQPGDERQALQAGLVAFLTEHLSTQDDGPLPEWLTTWITTSAESQARILRPAAANSGAATPGGRAGSECQTDGQTDGITLQVAPLAADLRDGEADDAPQDDPDRLRDIRGVVVFARDRTRNGPWQCLNLAQAVDPDDLASVLAEQVLLPSRLSYIEDSAVAESKVGALLQATLTYDNAPLSVPGPLGSTDAWLLHYGGTGETPDRYPVRFTFAPGTRIPGLAFGHRYCFAAALVGNSGVVPAAVRKGRSPWHVADQFPANAIPETCCVEVDYRRRVPVGAARVDGPWTMAAGNESVRIPLGVPEGVTPRLGELERPPAPSPPCGSQEGEAGARNAGRATPPLLLLHSDLGSGEEQAACRFEIRPPALDWRTWDRWIAADDEADGKELRQQVLARYHEIRYEIDCDRSGLSETRRREIQRALTLDDPAVVGFTVRVTDLESNQTVERDLALGPTPDEPDAGDDLLPAAVRVGPSILEITRRTPWKQDGSPTVQEPLDGPSPHGLRLELVEGHLYRLSLHARLAGVAGARFAATSMSQEPLWELDVEVAEPMSADRRKAEEYLSETLSVTAATSGVLEATLDLDAGAGDRDTAGWLQRNVVRAELLRQSWAWDGRPVPTHPELADAFAAVDPGGPDPLCPGDDQDALECWETLTLGHRDDAGHGLYPMSRSPRQEARGAGTDGTDGTDGAGGPSGGSLPHRWTWTEDLGSGPEAPDPRAGHHRFAVRVRSRYAGLYGRGRGTFESRRKDGDRGYQWRPAFVPCRWSGTVPPPRVRAVLPLTENRSGERPGQPFLVLLEEGWHEVGGLAERLDVELTTARVAFDQTPGEPCDLETRDAPVAGPDPLFATVGDTRTPLLAVSGAIGHSREIDTALPRIGATSFVVHARHPDDAPLDWWFLQVRFRRQVYVEVQEEGGTRAWKWKGSEPTTPFWVQLLPPFDLDRSGRVPRRVTWDGAVAKVEADGEERPALDGGGHLQPYLLLTRRLVDVLGRPGEVVLGTLHRASSDGELAFVPEDPLPASVLDLPDLQVRILEIQVRILEIQQENEDRVYTSSRDLWRALFPTHGDTVRNDVEARIVGLSKPIPVSPAPPKEAP